MKEKIDYTALDAAILAVIRTRSNWHPVYHKEVKAAAYPIAARANREIRNVINSRLQAMRKAGTIAHDRKAGRWIEVQA